MNEGVWGLCCNYLEPMMEKVYADEIIIHDDSAPVCRVQGVTE